MPRARRKKESAAPPPGEHTALRDFAAGLFAATGCEARDDRGVLHVTLTSELETALGAPELKLAFHAGDFLDPEIHLVQPGSVLLERIVTYLRERSQAALGEVPANTVPDASLPPEMEFRCSASLARVEAEPEEYATFNFRISYTCDEKNEELHSVTVDSEGRPADAGVIARFAAAEPAAGELETSRRALGILYAAAEERARAHAEQAAIGFERETLPRLYRAVARLRAFYQAQMGELDPRVEEDAALLTHLERELRLRTDEEVSNHRMTVALSLVSYRIIRVPHARLHVRLSGAGARRTHVFSRDLSTGALLPQACEACSKPLAAADLCAEGHLVCPTCVSPCAICGRAGCAECGVQTCARCERRVCTECRVTCAACENVVCSEHSTLCPVCSRPTCDACLGRCAACGESQCSLHLEPCGVCGEAVCTRCAEACAICGGRFCPEHTATCERCGRVVCSEHLGRCAECGAARCEAHLAPCSVCGRRLCDEHRRECGGCGADVCPEHAEACAVCGAGVCEACGSHCAVTGKALCPEHVTMCDFCGRPMTPSLAPTCAECGQTACPEHMRECVSCGTVLCAGHAPECRLCGGAVCERCAGGIGVCPTCTDLEAGEPCPADEVLALEGLPDAWRTRARRAAWRRVRRSDRTVYYGHHLFRVIVITAGAEGSFLRDREFSVAGVPGAGPFG